MPLPERLPDPAPVENAADIAEAAGGDILQFLADGFEQEP
jgi:hypothetical protein